MIDAARKAARGLARDFGEVTELQVSKKGAADFVSAADLKDYNAVRSRHLGSARPASTLVVVHALARPEWRVEVEGVAWRDR